MTHPSLVKDLEGKWRQKANLELFFQQAGERVDRGDGVAWGVVLVIHTELGPRPPRQLAPRRSERGSEIRKRKFNFFSSPPTV